MFSKALSIKLTYLFINVCNEQFQHIVNEMFCSEDYSTYKERLEHSDPLNFSSLLFFLSSHRDCVILSLNGYFFTQTRALFLLLASCANWFLGTPLGAHSSSQSCECCLS